MTKDLKKRAFEHKNGYSPTTKRFSEIELVHSEMYKTYRGAEKRELQIKGWSFAKKKALISGDKDLLIKLSKSHGFGDAIEK